MNLKQKKKLAFPSALTILLVIITIIVLLSWIPMLADKPAGLVDIFWAPLKSFTSEKRSKIIIFLLILGAFINVTMKSHALDAFINKIINKLKNKELWLIPLLMLFFSISGSIYGMAEETLGFYALIIPIMVAARFDTFTGLLIILLGAGIGNLGSTINPFSIRIAIEEAISKGVSQELSLVTGMVWRIVIWILMTSVAIAYTTFYAYRVRQNHKKSVVFRLHNDHEIDFAKEQTTIIMTKRHISTLIIFGLTFLLMILYLIPWSEFNIYFFKDLGEYINENVPYITRFIFGLGEGGTLEASVFFFISTIIIGFINWTSEKNFINDALQGSADILSVCLVISFAGGIGVILEQTGMQNKIVHGLKNSLNGLSNLVIPIVLYILFIPLAFLIPSTSGFATAVFGIIGPAIGVTLTSNAITSFTLASGIVNLITPTAGVVMGAITLSKVPYQLLLKGMWPILLVIFILSILLLFIGSLIGSPIF